MRAEMNSERIPGSHCGSGGGGGGGGGGEARWASATDLIKPFSGKDRHPGRLAQ